MTPTLYIIMRADIADMNPGKAMAQAAHAQADFEANLAAKLNTELPEDGLSKAISEWREDRTFGRTLVVSGTLAQMQEVCSYGGVSGQTIDPTYPWRNYYGDLFTTEEITCAWVFIYDESYSEEVSLMKSMRLHP